MTRPDTLFVLVQRTFLALVFVFLYCTGIAFAQTGTIAGRVLDAATGTPLAGVNVRLLEASLGTSTDAEGRFTLINVPAGEHTIVASFIGYGTVSRVTRVSDGAHIQLDLTMTAETLGLESIVVTGVRVTEAEPGNLILTDRDLSRVQASTLASFLSNQSTVAVGGGSPVAQKVYVRGFEDVMLNVRIDGAQNAGELYHHQARLQLEPEFIKQIVLDAGAGAATNGPGALTGSMHVTTKSAFDMLEPGRSLGAWAKGTVGTNGENRYKGSGLVYGRLTEGLGLIAGLTYEDGGDYADGHGNLATPTAFEHWRGFSKLSGNFGPHTFHLSFERLDDQGVYYERPNLIGFRETYQLADHDMGRSTVSLNYSYRPESETVDLQTRAYWTESTFENARLSTPDTFYGKGSFASLGFEVRNTSRFGAVSLIYGVDGRWDDGYGAQNATPPPFWGTSEQSASVAGVFTQAHLPLLEERIELSGGLRIDRYEHEVLSGVGEGASNHAVGLSPNVAAQFEWIDGLTVRGSYAQAFRGVTIREAFFSSLYTHRGDLKPERADNLELGLQFERAGFFVRGTLYRQTIQNFVDAVYQGEEVWGYWENVGDARVDGYEAEVGGRWNTSRFSVGVWESEPTLNDEPLTDAMLGLGTSIGRTWTARLEHLLAAPGIDLVLIGRFVEKEENTIGENAPDKPSYGVVDLHAAWQPQPLDRIRLGISVTNLLNEFYYDHATYFWLPQAQTYVGFPSRGRELLLSLSYRF